MGDSKSRPERLSESYIQPAQVGQPNSFEPLHVSIERGGRRLVLIDRSVYSERHCLHTGRFRYVVFEYKVEGSALVHCDLCGEPEGLLKTATPVRHIKSTDDRSLAVEVFRNSATVFLAGTDRPVAQGTEPPKLEGSVRAGDEACPAPTMADPGSNPGGPTNSKDWPLGDFWVVSYQYQTEFIATRHRGGCGVLRNARMTQDEGSGGRFGRLSVIEEERYQESRRRNPNLPDSDDHSCCAHAAPVASFRFAEVAP